MIRMSLDDKDARVIGELRDIREDLNEKIQKELDNKGLLESVFGGEKVKGLQEARDLIHEHLEVLKKG